MQELWPLRGVTQDQRWGVEPDRLALQSARVGEDRCRMCSKCKRVEIAHRRHQFHAIGNVVVVRGNCGTGSRVCRKEHRHAKMLCGNSQHIKRSAQPFRLTHISAVQGGVRESTRDQWSTDMQRGSIKGSSAARC